MKRFIEDWLERVGYEQGYNWDNLPEIDEMMDEEALEQARYNKTVHISEPIKKIIDKLKEKE